MGQKPFVWVIEFKVLEITALLKKFTGEKMTTYKEYKNICTNSKKYLHLAYYSDLKGVYSCENYDGQENQVKLAEITEAGTRARFGSFYYLLKCFCPRNDAYH